MGWSNLILGVRDLHNVIMAYVNAINFITTIVETTPPSNIITNETILTQYSIKQLIQIFGKKVKASVQK